MLKVNSKFYALRSLPFILIVGWLVLAANTSIEMESKNVNEEIQHSNVFGEALISCCFEPMTGYFRDGYCRTDGRDYGVHTVCAVMTEGFLDFTKSRGNDLSTPRPEYNFPGLKEGDQWCLCAIRWYEAYKEGYAPLVRLEATHAKTLEIVPIEALEEMAIKSK